MVLTEQKHLRVILQSKNDLEKEMGDGAFNDITYLAFLDLEKTFDRVLRQTLWQAMK